MPANKYALLRYRIIDKCIRNKYRPYPSKEDLRQACEEALYNSLDERVSESTIEKDLYAMRNEEGLGYLAPIKYSRELNGYYYEDPEYSIDDMPLNEDDIEAIRFAANTLSQFRSIGVFSEFENAIDKLMGRISISEKLEDSAIQSFVSFESSPPAKGTEFLKPLLSAIKHREKLQIEYKSFLAGVSSVRIIHPCLIKEYRNRWYLLAYEESSGRIKTFGLDRLKSIENLSDNFVPDKSFDPEEYFKYSFGISASQNPPVSVQLKFDHVQGSYIKSQPLHHSQKIIQENESGLFIELYLQLSPEFTMQLLSFGNKVEVITPKELKETMKSELESALEKYS